ncbi:MAG: hypothetical protein ACREX6_04710, partial [Casimicrobiaceae bacterium]
SPQDVVLRAGDNWVVECDGDTVIEAQGKAVFRAVARRGIAQRRLKIPHPEPHRGGASLRAWLLRLAAPNRRTSHATPYY